MRFTAASLISAAGALALCVSARTAGEEAVDYKFNQAPVNAMGVTGMADLRGKPVLIDFWGTR